MDTKKERYRRIRGAILKFLAHQHPGPIDEKVLFFLLDDLRYSCTAEEFESHIAYLIEVALIREDKRNTGGIAVRMYTISAKGLNVLDGFDADPGVCVNF